MPFFKHRIVENSNSFFFKKKSVLLLGIEEKPRDHDDPHKIKTAVEYLARALNSMQIEPTERYYTITIFSLDFKKAERNKDRRKRIQIHHTLTNKHIGESVTITSCAHKVT